MTTATPPLWEDKRTPESRNVEELLGKHFEQVDSYRYNSASIRVRVIDSRFEGLSREERGTLVEPYLDQLPIETQQDIVALFTFAPSEIEQTPKMSREFLINLEFEEPSESML